MGCITANIWKENEQLKANITMAKRELNANVAMVGGRLNAWIGLICETNKDVYLYVEPDVIWLTPDTMGADFNVRSNTRWRIE